MATKPSQSKARKPRTDAQRNRERILQVAKQAFSRSGASASLDEIAKQAGVGPGTLYRHFPTREDLLAAVYRGDVASIAARADALAAELPPMEALTAWLGEQLVYITQRRGLGSAIKVMLGNDTETMDW